MLESTQRYEGSLELAPETVIWMRNHHDGAPALLYEGRTKRVADRHRRLLNAATRPD